MKSGYIDSTLVTRAEATFASSVCAGRLPWNVLHPFPEPDPEKERGTDKLLEEVVATFAARVDPERLEETGEFPPELIEDIKALRYDRLMADEGVDGHGQSVYGVFRILQAVAGRSIASAQTLAITATIGPSGIQRVLPPSPLRDYLRSRLRDGIIGGFIDTNPEGQNNALPSLTATLTEDGSAYILNGRKLYTGDGPIADLIGLSATTVVDGVPKVCFPFVETDSPGLTVLASLEFIGSKGFPVGELEFVDVRVPAEHVLTNVEDPELMRQLTPVALVFRILNISSLITAIGRLCLRWGHDFAARRRINGRVLGEYEAIERLLALNLADVYAIDATTRWALLSSHENAAFEQLVTKPITARAGWRVIDRTLSLFGAEGLETAASKRRRGAEPVPLERYYRDARMLRTNGNVDFQIDNQAGRMLLARIYADPDTAFAGGLDEGLAAAAEAPLAPVNRAHLAEVARRAGALARVGAELTRRYPDPEELFERETVVILFSRIAGELLAVCATLARTSQLAAQGTDQGQDLADLYCTEAWHRVADLDRRLAAELTPPGTRPDHGALARAFGAGDLDFLTTC